MPAVSVGTTRRLAFWAPMAGADGATVFPDGGLRLFGLIGDPVAQVRACQPATERMRAAGANAALLPVHIPSLGAAQRA